MRRIGAALASVAVVLLGTPAVAETPAETSAQASAAAGCTATALPVPADATGGASVAAIVEPGTYLGRSGSEPYQGMMWRNGTLSPLPISPSAVNPSGLVVGYEPGVNGRLARMRLGGTPQYSWNSTYLDDINADGVAVGSLVFADLVLIAHAVVWRPGEAEPTTLPGPVRTGAWAIDDLGYKIGYGQTSEGERREVVWDADDRIVREFGPYDDNDVKLYPRDIDDGVALTTRYQPSGAKDLVLVDVVTGEVTALPDTDGLRGEHYEDGWIAGDAGDFVTPVVWHDGAQVSLPAPPGTEPRLIEDVHVVGSTAILSGYSVSYSPRYLTPTVWRCT